MGGALMLSRYYIPGGVLLIGMLEMMGFGILFIGVIILAGRNSQTGAGYWLDLPSNSYTISIHSGIANKRLDPNARFIRVKDIGLGLLKGKKKVFKDTGGGFRVAGHDVRRTHEKIGADLPEWLGQYVHQVKEKWKCSNDEEMKTMYDILKNIREPSSEFGISIADQLKMHRVFNEALTDPVSKEKIESMTIDEVHKMTEHLFDGETVHMEDLENFIKLAKPNELDTWIDQEVSRGERERKTCKTYRDPGSQIDWNKWLPALGMFAFIAMLGTVILISYFD